MHDAYKIEVELSILKQKYKDIPYITTPIAAYAAFMKTELEKDMIDIENEYNSIRDDLSKLIAEKNDCISSINNSNLLSLKETAISKKEYWSAILDKIKILRSAWGKDGIPSLMLDSFIDNTNTIFKDIFRRLCDSTDVEIIRDGESIDYRCNIGPIRLLSESQLKSARLAMKIALAQQTTGILLLDELTDTLDEHHKSKYMNLLTELSNNLQIIVSSQDESLISIADTVVQLGN